VLAWMMFWASRLAIILQGGVAISSRLNYGAGMAVALLAAALARWAWHRWCSRALVLRWVATIGVVGSVALMALAIAGRARHNALSSQAENYTITTLARFLADQPEVRSITIVGTPVPEPDMGELGYFSEPHGHWLAYVLARLGFEKQVRVVRGKDLDEKPGTMESVFVWSGNWPEARLQHY